MFKDLIIKNRSTRGYDRSHNVSNDTLLEMIDCARLSASSMSVQPLKFYPTTDVNETSLITSNVKFAGALPELGLPLEGTEPPAYILICQDLRIHPNDQRFLKDVGIYAQTMSLCAVEQGLNCLMIGAFNSNKIKELLNLPDYFTILLILAVGKGAEHIELVDFDSPEPPIDMNDEAVLEAYRKEDLAKAQYYRADGIHYAPKRKLEDVIIHR